MDGRHRKQPLDLKDLRVPVVGVELSSVVNSRHLGGKLRVGADKEREGPLIARTKVKGRVSERE